MNAKERVVVTTTVAVDPATAFEIFTREVDLWWRRGPRFRPHPGRGGRMRFEPGVGGRLLEVYGGDDAFELGRIVAWEPALRLVFEMGGRDFGPADPRTEVEVRFEPAAEGTRVTVEHRGWERLPEDHPVRHGLRGTAFTAMMGHWWADLLLALRAHGSRAS